MRLFGVFLLCVVSVVVVMQLIVWVLRYELKDDVDLSEIGKIDAVVVPGGGVRANGELPPWVTARFDAAMRIPSELRRHMIALSSGTTHRAPPRDQNDFPISEARAGAAYLMNSGVNSSQILTEDLSLDTIGNAFWLRLLHTDVRRWYRLHIITNSFHMPRTREIFQRVFALPMHDNDQENKRRWFGGSNSDDTDAYTLTFESVPNIGLSDDVLREREAREAASLEAFKKGPVSRVRSMQDLHRFMHTTHNAYRIDRDYGEKLSEKVRKSY